MSALANTNKPIIFHFGFSFGDDDDDENSRTELYGFVIESPLPLYSSLGVDDFEVVKGVLDEECEEGDFEEKYGSHHIYGAGACVEVYSMGYSSYEIDESKVNELMAAWRSKFLERGCVCSEIVQIYSCKDMAKIMELSEMRDIDIYNSVIEKTRPKAFKL